MYKVFVNDEPIFIGESKKISTKLDCLKFNKANIIDQVLGLFEGNKSGLFLISSSLPNDWSEFKNLFKNQIAAGGKVVNSNGEVLFIYRNNKWDLPKGKVEKGESLEECAIREVEEECGISGLKLEKHLETTYHIFRQNGDLVLKISHWFLMFVDFNGILIPQKEEGIEEVCFKDSEEQLNALENTYANIKLLFHH